MERRWLFVVVVLLLIEGLRADPFFVKDDSYNLVVTIGGRFSADFLSSNKHLTNVGVFEARIGSQVSTGNSPNYQIYDGMWKKSLGGQSLRTSGFVVAAAFFNVGTESDPNADNLILIGGNFTYVEDQPCGHIARLYIRNGTTVPLEVGLNGPVYSMARTSENVTLVGGAFTALQTRPAVGARYLALYDIQKDQWSWVGVASLLSPPQYLVTCLEKSKVWVIGFYDRLQVLCTVPACTKMYMVTGNISKQGNVEFGYGLDGADDDVLLNTSFYCSGIHEPGESPCEIAFFSSVENFATMDGSLYMLMVFKEEEFSDIEPYNISKKFLGYSSFWVFDQHLTRWEYITHFQECLDQEGISARSTTWLKQIIEADRYFAISGAFSLFLFDPICNTCIVLNDEVDMYFSGLVYSANMSQLIVFDYYNRTDDSSFVGDLSEAKEGSGVAVYNMSSDPIECYLLGNLTNSYGITSDSDAKIFSLSSMNLVGTFGLDMGTEVNHTCPTTSSQFPPENEADTDDNIFSDIGFYRYIFVVDAGGILWAQQFGSFNQYDGTSQIRNVSLWAEGTVFSVEYNTSLGGMGSNDQMSITSAMGGAFGEVGDEAAAGLVMCLDQSDCDDDDDVWLPILSAHSGKEREQAGIFVFPGPGQFGIQSLLIHKDDFYIGGQFAWTNTTSNDTSTLSIGNFVRYRSSDGGWVPLGDFIGGWKGYVSVVYDIYHFCGNLFLTGLFEMALDKEKKTQWAVMFDIETEEWIPIGPNGVGFPSRSGLYVPRTIAADHRYVYIGGEAMEGKAAVYFWDRLNPSSPWRPLAHIEDPTKIMVTGTVHDIQLQQNILLDSYSVGYSDEPGSPEPDFNTRFDIGGDDDDDDDDDWSINGVLYCNITWEMVPSCGEKEFCPPSILYLGGNFEMKNYRHFAICKTRPEESGEDLCGGGHTFCCKPVGANEPDNTVRVISVLGSYAIIGGAFTKVGQLFAPGVAMWDGLNWNDFSGLQNFAGTVFSLSARIQKQSPKERDGWEDWYVYVLVGVTALLLVLFAAFVIARRKQQSRKFYLNIDIPEDGRRPEITLATILTSGKIRVIPWEDFVLGRRLGVGVAGEVFAGTLRGSKPVAIKMLHFYNASHENSKFIENFLFEIIVISGLSHPNLVTFLGVSIDKSSKELALVTELMSRGSLADVLDKKRRFLPLKLKIKIAKDISEGLKYLHRYQPPIIHRDLKPANILVADDWTCKIGDLGVSTFKQQNQSGMAVAGSPVYMAPEIIMAKKFGELSDCYSLAILLCDLFGPCKPYSEEEFLKYSAPSQLMYAVVHENLRPNIPQDCPKIVQSIIFECFMKDPKLRPSANEICSRLKRIRIKETNTSNFSVQEISKYPPLLEKEKMEEDDDEDDGIPEEKREEEV